MTIDPCNQDNPSMLSKKNPPFLPYKLNIKLQCITKKCKINKFPSTLLQQETNYLPQASLPSFHNHPPTIKNNKLPTITKPHHPSFHPCIWKRSTRSCCRRMSIGHIRILAEADGYALQQSKSNTLSLHSVPSVDTILIHIYIYIYTVVLVSHILQS